MLLEYEFATMLSIAKRGTFNIDVWIFSICLSLRSLLNEPQGFPGEESQWSLVFLVKTVVGKRCIIQNTIFIESPSLEETLQSYLISGASAYILCSLAIPSFKTIKTYTCAIQHLTFWRYVAFFHWPALVSQESGHARLK